MEGRGRTRERRLWPRMQLILLFHQVVTLARAFFLDVSSYLFFFPTKLQTKEDVSDEVCYTSELHGLEKTMLEYFCCKVLQLGLACYCETARPN